MNNDEIKKHIKEIKVMTREELAFLHRFATRGHIYFDPNLPFYAVFKARFNELDNFSPEISKEIGWE